MTNTKTNTTQVYIINGSPRKNWNTAKMCKRKKKGVTDAGLKAEIINLYDLNYKGCYSCFACKVRNGKSYGKCNYPDELKEVLEKVSNSEGLILASHIYFGEVTAQMRAFMERLLFPVYFYDEAGSKIPPKKLETAIIYTMNVKHDRFNAWFVGTDKSGPLGLFEKWIEMTYEKPEILCAYDTLQFGDYSKYVADVWDVEEKKKHNEEEFPKELESAYKAGVKMAERIKGKLN